MRYLSRWMFASGCGALAMVLWPSTALAQYLDPGAGSIIVQVVIAVLVGVGATVKVYWRTISAFLSRRSKRDVSI